MKNKKPKHSKKTATKSKKTAPPKVTKIGTPKPSEAQKEIRRLSAIIAEAQALADRHADMTQQLPSAFEILETLRAILQERQVPASPPATPPPPTP